MKLLTKALLLTGTILLPISFTGCSATGKQFTNFTQPSTNKGILYVYRPSSFVGAAVSVSVYDITNKKEIGSLQNGGYIKYETKPGKITLSFLDDPSAGVVLASNAFGPTSWVKLDQVDKPQNIFTLNLKKNNITCIRWYSMADETVPNGRVDRKTCSKEILSTKLSSE